VVEAGDSENITSVLPRPETLPGGQFFVFDDIMALPELSKKQQRCLLSKLS